MKVLRRVTAKALLKAIQRSAEAIPKAPLNYSKGSLKAIPSPCRCAKAATQLALLLVQDGRIADLERIASDPVYYQRLLKEYGLIQQ